MSKILNFFEHVQTAITCGEWSCGFEMWENKPMFMCKVMPYDGWNFCFHIYKFYLCCSYPWCGELK